MKKIIWLLGFGILFTLTNCTQKETPTTHVQPIYARAATYQPGSYYVFRDSVTNGLDSFYVTQCDTSLYFNTDAWIENLNTNFKDNQNNEFGFNASPDNMVYFYYKISGSAPSGGFIFGINLRPGYSEEYGNFSNRCLQVLDSISIDNRVFYRVYETLYQNYVNSDTTYLHKWYSLQDGLIKLRIHGNGIDKVYTTLRHLQLN